MRKAGWEEAAAAFVRRVKSVPRLWLVPAAAVLVEHAVKASGLRGGASAFIGLVVFLGANAVFAELWAAADSGFDGDRFFETIVLFLIPLPLLAAVAFAGGLAYARVTSDAGVDTIMTATRVMLYGYKALVLAAMILSVVSIPSLSAAKDGALGALRRGARVFARNLGLVLAAVVAAALFEYALGSLWEAWRASAYDASAAELVFSRLLQAFALEAAILFGGVALPLQALESGLLEKP